MSSAAGEASSGAHADDRPSAGSGPVLPPDRPVDVLQDLFTSVLASRERARRRVLAMQDIERRHVDTPLSDLAALAANGELDVVAGDSDDPS